jgi:hypothetical protein
MSKKVVMLTLALCLILGLGIFAVQAMLLGIVDAEADFKGPSLLSSQYRAYARTEAIHPRGIWSLWPHTHVGTYYLDAQSPAGGSTAYSRGILLWSSPIGASTHWKSRKQSSSLPGGHATAWLYVGDHLAHSRSDFEIDSTP